MKNCGKKLLALALAAAMSGCMVSAFANTVSFESVQVIKSDGETVKATYTAEQIASGSVKIAPGEYMVVSAKLSPGENASLTAGDITFLSHNSGATELNNNNIQYVDQQMAEVSENSGTATIKFSPRTSLTTSKGTFVAKAGGTDVAAAAEFNYTVEEEKKTMTITGVPNASITVGTSVTITLKQGENPVTDATVKATDKSNAENVVPATDNADGTYTMTFTAAGTYTISAAKDGFNDVVSSEFSVNAKPVDTEKVTKSVEETLKNVNGGGKAASLPTNAAVDGENKDIAYKVEGGKAAIEISEDGTKTLKLNDNAFAAKVDLVATVDGVDVHKTVYLKADSTTQIAFGNLALISNAEGADAFTDDEKFSAALADAANKAAVELTRAEALNYVINNSQPNDVIASAIDYDGKDGITLSEYRMFKLLINGNTDFSASKISAARAALTNADSAQETTNE